VKGRVRIGLAGLGRMGRIHAANLSGRCPSAQLACVYDADSEVAREAAAELDVPWAASYEDMLADGGIDAVAIATPTRYHAELAIAASGAGKHIFCEKPISLDRPDTVATVEQVQASGVTFQPGFHRRFDPDWVAAVDRMRAGELGEVYLFRTSLRDMTPPKVEFLAGSGGFFVDVTIHDLDTARWMVGEVVQVSAHGSALSDPRLAEIGDIDTAVVVLHFASGALGVIDNSRAAGYGYECSTEVMGALATVRIDHPQHHHYEWRTPGWARQDLVRDFEQRYPQAYTEELEAFARAVIEGTPPRVTAQDALAAFDLAQAATRSWRSGLPVSTHPLSRTSRRAVPRTRSYARGPGSVTCSAARPIRASRTSAGRERTSPMSCSATISSSTPSSGASVSRLSRTPRYSSAETARPGSSICSFSARNRAGTEVSRTSASAVSSAAVKERWPRSA
jgi:myo-inositol 2-dehydrogenase/D-chiro-inositol 1-dehydrogenase